MAILQRVGAATMFSLDTAQVRIGRAPDNELILDDETASGHHALITERREDGQILHILEDLNSTNHTYVNNKEIARHILLEGDIIRIGRTRFKFSAKIALEPKPDFTKTRQINSTQVSDYLVAK